MNLTVLDLLVPSLWHRGHCEANADLYVSLDGLALQSMQRRTWWEFVRHPVTQGIPLMVACNQELAYHRVLETFPPTLQARIRGELRALWTQPVLEALRDGKPVGATRTASLGSILLRWPGGRTALLDNWNAWLQGLRNADVLFAGGTIPCDRSETLIWALEGLWGSLELPHSTAIHGTPVLVGTLWSEVLEQYRWLLCMAGLFELQGEDA